MPSPFAPESFHLMKVRAVYPGSDAAPNAQYVMLQVYAPGQNLVSGKQVQVYDSAGTLVTTFTFPANVPVAADQSTILIATAEAQAFFAPGGPLLADLVMTPVLGRPWSGGSTSAARRACSTPATTRTFISVSFALTLYGP
jgi:hypothetical protein